MSGEAEFQAFKDRLRRRLLGYLRKAFRMIPPSHRPHILDIGCGSGVPTLELARLSGGQVIGLDIDSSLLNILNEKIEKAGLSDRVTALNRSMFEMDFAAETFDIIWAEGSLSRIGFSPALGEWRRFLKPGGFLVAHDEGTNLKAKTAQVSVQGYELIGSFILDEKTWWDEYFAPLERRIRETRTKRSVAPEVLAMLDAEQREVDRVKRDPSRSRSVYFIMKKTD